MDSNTWLEAKFSLSINPSSANYIEAFFHCDSLRQNGWVIRMGDADDDIQLILRKNGQSQTILKGAKGYFNRSKSNITLRIVKQPEQIILLYKDSAWDQFQCLGAGIDTMWNKQSFHGWSIIQSGSSAAGKHKVEQWYIGPPRPDKKPPQLLKIDWLQPQIAKLYFSEPIQIPERNQLICNFNAADTLLEITSRTITVKFPVIRCNEINIVHCQNFLDTANNVAPHLLDSSLAECPTPIYADQIIFTEIMVDPTPSLGHLPDAQYLEIYNTTDTAKWLQTLTLSDPQSYCILPKYLLPAKSFLILHNDPDTGFNFLKNKAIRMANLPHFNIDGDELLLKYFNDTIHQLNYNDKWYHPQYSGGGYSLEKTNLQCGCINNFNWHSNHDDGGTPGTRNSLPLNWPSPRGTISKIEPPQSRIVNHQWQTNQILEILSNSSPEIDNSSHSKSGPLPQLILISANGDSIRSKFINTTKNGWVFQIETKEPIEASAKIINAKDCAHRFLMDTQFQIFKSPVEPEVGDIQFNEVMFNANDGSVDFLELINPNNKAIELNGLELLIETDQLSVQRILLCNESKILYPNQVICFSTNPYALAKTYNPERNPFHQICTVFPNLPATGATLKLTKSNSTQFIDIMQYNDNMHNDLINETKGISLEKNHPKAPSSSQQFWISAAATVGYATPAESNSQLVNLNTSKTNKKCFSLLDNIVGLQSYLNSENSNQLQLAFNMPQPGYIITASIYNMQGSLMGVPIFQVMIGKEDILPIPILTANGTLSEGNYIIHIDAFHRDADICTQNLRWIYLNR
jgi:hypothetical protein